MQGHQHDSAIQQYSSALALYRCQSSRHAGGVPAAYQRQGISMTVPASICALASCRYVSSRRAAYQCKGGAVGGQEVGAEGVWHQNPHEGRRDKGRVSNAWGCIPASRKEATPF